MIKNIDMLKPGQHNDEIDALVDGSPTHALQDTSPPVVSGPAALEIDLKSARVGMTPPVIDLGGSKEAVEEEEADVELELGLTSADRKKVLEEAAVVKPMIVEETDVPHGDKVYEPSPHGTKEDNKGVGKLESPLKDVIADDEAYETFLGAQAGHSTVT